MAAASQTLDDKWRPAFSESGKDGILVRLNGRPVSTKTLSHCGSKAVSFDDTGGQRRRIAMSLFRQWISRLVLKVEICLTMIAW